MTDTPNKHVLIVEDSQDLQILLGRLFKREGYTLSQAFNGQQALDLLRSMPMAPSFILLDIMMPVMDGIQFRKAQMQDPKLAQIPVIIMTADAEPQAKANQMGVKYFFPKPIGNISQLLQVAETLGTTVDTADQ
jgi:CheY-like chemotaxis protein